MGGGRGKASHGDNWGVQDRVEKNDHNKRKRLDPREGVEGEDGGHGDSLDDQGSKKLTVFQNPERH